MKILEKNKVWFRSWVGSLIFAGFFSAFVRWCFVDHYLVPSSSMEGTILAGDHLLVSKFHYGVRVPVTPLQIPLTHKEVFGIKSYLDWIKLPAFRFFDFWKVKRGDVIVLNCPFEIDFPLDLREYYIKRCVGLAGDRVSIIDGDLYINEQKVESIDSMQFRFFINSIGSLEEYFFKKKNIKEFIRFKEGYLVNISKSLADILSKREDLKISKLLENKDFIDRRIFYNLELENGCNGDNFGPLVIPYCGMKINIDKKNLSIYGFSILNHEGNKDVKILDSRLYIEGSEVFEYTFKQDYYFGMGDNRHNSLDSRYWGFIPEDHIVGKALVVLISRDLSESNFINSLRVGRIFKRV